MISFLSFQVLFFLLILYDFWSIIFHPRVCPPIVLAENYCSRCVQLVLRTPTFCILKSLIAKTVEFGCRKNLKNIIPRRTELIPRKDGDEKKNIYNKEESKPSHAVTEICNSLLSTDRGYETKSRLCPKRIIKVNDIHL